MDELLRVEARPRSASELTRTQIDALERILDVLAAAVVDLPKPTEWHGEDSPSKSLDEQRKSRIFFLSGEAGTGKTTVYLWLRKYASPSTKHEDLCKELQSLREAGGKQGSIATQLEKLHHGLVWLEPLALEEVANAATNYLAAILARIDQVLTDKLGTGTGGATSSSDRLGFDRPGMTEALTEFERLRTDIGLSWDGNLPQRGEHLDPDVFAEEVMRAEGARIRVNRRFHEVLEKLTERIYERDRAPLFVLPVDDLSLNPGPSLEILRLLRMISVPRLFILALGDESTFEELGFQRVLGDQICLAGEEAFKVGRQRRVLMARARQLSFNAQRKLMPPGQRESLVALYWDETLTKIRTGGRGTDGPPGRSLWKALHAMKLEDLLVPRRRQNSHGHAKWTLLEFLAYPGESCVDLSKVPRDDETHGSKTNDLELDKIFRAATGLESAYTGLQILEVPVRHAIDLLLSLPSLEEDADDRNEWHRRQERQNKLFRWIGDEALRHLNEQNYMSDEGREHCEEAIRGPWYTSVSLDTTELGVQPDYESSFTTADWPAKEDQGQSSFQAMPVIEVRPHRRWRLGPKDAIADRAVYQSQQRPVGTWSFMPPRPLAWFVLLHDLLVLTRNHGLQGDPLLPAWDGHCWAGTRWCSLVNARRSDETVRSKCWEEPSFLPWPVPEWSSFWHFDGFLAGWNAVLAEARELREFTEVGETEEIRPEHRKLRKRQEIENSLVYWWIRLAVDVFRLSAVPEDRRVTEGLLPAFCSLPDWDELLNDLGKLSDEASTSGYRHAVMRWFLHLGVLAAPEYGLSRDVRARILDNEPIAPVMSGGDAARYIRKVRARTILGFFPNADTRKKLESKANTRSSTWNAIYLRLRNEDPRFGTSKKESRNWFPTDGDLKEAIQFDREARRLRQRRVLSKELPFEPRG